MSEKDKIGREYEKVLASGMLQFIKKVFTDTKFVVAKSAIEKKLSKELETTIEGFLKAVKSIEGGALGNDGRPDLAKMPYQTVQDAFNEGLPHAEKLLKAYYQYMEDTFNLHWEKYFDDLMGPGWGKHTREWGKFAGGGIGALINGKNPLKDEAFGALLGGSAELLAQNITGDKALMTSWTESIAGWMKDFFGPACSSMGEMLGNALTFQSTESGEEDTAFAEQLAKYKEDINNAQIGEFLNEVISQSLTGISAAIVDIITGVQSAEDAFKALGKTMLKIIADFMVKYIANEILMAALGKQMLGQHAVVSTATAAKVAAAWSKAAAMVSLATFGANAGPAAIAIATVTGLASTLALVPFAFGGIVTGPTPALIGEGRYAEAVLPLNKRYFEKAGLLNDGSVTTITQNNYGDINTEADYKRLYDDLGYAVWRSFKGA